MNKASVFKRFSFYHSGLFAIRDYYGTHYVWVGKEGKVIL